MKNTNTFQKARVPVLVESTKIENTTLPYETVLPVVNVKTNRMRSTKWTYDKELSITSTLFFSKILFQFKILV